MEENQMHIYSVIEEDYPPEEEASFRSRVFLTQKEAEDYMQGKIEDFLRDYSTPDQIVESPHKGWWEWRSGVDSQDRYIIYIQVNVVTVNGSLQDIGAKSKPTWPHTPDRGELLNALESIENSGRSEYTVKELLEEMRRE